MKNPFAYFTLLLIITLAIGCDSVVNDDQLQRLRQQGESLAGTAVAGAPTAVANARELAATARVAAPTAVVDARAAAATAAAAAATVAANAAAQGQDLATLAQALLTRAGSLLPDSDGNIRLEISEAELTALLRSRERNEAADSRFENLNATMTDGLITISGDVTRPVRVPFAVLFRPLTIDGSLTFEVVSATIGAIDLPGLVVDRIEDRLNGTLGAALAAVPGNLTVSAVEVSEGRLIIIGRLARNSR